MARKSSFRKTRRSRRNAHRGRRGYSVDIQPHGDSKFRVTVTRGLDGQSLSELVSGGREEAESYADSLIREIEFRNNPRRHKTKTRDQVRKMQEKAVNFLRNVVGNQDKADEIEGMSLSEYAAHKKVSLSNPSREPRGKRNAGGRLKTYRVPWHRMSRKGQGGELQVEASSAKEARKIAAATLRVNEHGDFTIKAVKLARGNPGGKNACKSYRDKCVPASQMAFVGDPRHPTTWALRVDNANHVRDAMARFSRTRKIPRKYRRAVAEELHKYAKKFGIDDKRFAAKYLGKKNPVIGSYRGFEIQQNFNGTYFRAVRRSDGAATRWFTSRRLLEKYLDSGKPRFTFSNPESEAAQAEKLYETFHQEPPREVLEFNQEIYRPKDYTVLGELIELRLRWLGLKLDFEGEDVMLASNAAGTQMYFIGGNQDLRDVISEAAGKIDQTKDFLFLGEIDGVVYRARKEFTNFEETDWDHKLGEDGHKRPVLMYDKLNREMMMVGGEYQVKYEGIIH